MTLGLIATVGRAEVETLHDADILVGAVASARERWEPTEKEHSP